MPDWSPSARQVERDAVRRRLRRRSATVATVATVVVLGLLAFVVTASPGWTRVQETFFSWEDAKASFPEVLKGFGKNVLLFLIAEPLILVLGALVAVVRSHDVGGPVPAAAAGGVLHRPPPRRPDAARGDPGRLRHPGAAAPGRHQRHVLARAGGAGAVVRRVRRRGLPGRHRLDPPVAGRQRRRPRASRTDRRCATSSSRRPPVAWCRRCSTTSSRSRRTPRCCPRSSSSRRCSRRRTTRAYNFNYTPIVVVAVLFVALTIPLARFTDWMGRRMLRRERAGAR